MKIKQAAFPLLIILLYFYLTLFANALTDDAFITLRYVKTLLSTGTWGFLPGYITNAVTSPLNIFLLAFVGLFLGPTVHAVLWLTAGILAFTTLILIRLSEQMFDTAAFGYLAAGALTFNPLILSTLGLESVLFLGLYVLATYLYVSQRWLLMAVTLGLLTLTRFDGVLFFLVALLLVPSIAMRLRFAATYLLCIAPWYLYSWIYLGSLLPDTLFIKTAQRSWDTRDFFNGLGLYYDVYPFEVILSVFLLPFVLLLLNKRVREQSVFPFLFLTGIAHFAGYSLLRVPPYYWYYVPQITAIALIASLGLGVISQDIHWKLRYGTGIQALAATLLISQMSGMFYLLARDGFMRKEMPIHTNWATHEEYREIGEWLKENSSAETILVNGEIGTLGYYCDCSLSSFFSDRRWLGQYVRDRSAGAGVRPVLYRINFLFFDQATEFPEPAYLLSQFPSGKDTSIQAIKEWRTKTRWIPNCLIKLSHYDR